MQLWSWEIAILSLYLALMPAVSAATCQVLSTGSLVDHGHRLASYDTSLVVSANGGVDCGRRRRHVYDEKPQRYAKDNKTAHLTARDKSVAYVTNNKRLYSTFCTVEANYWHTRSIARPLCDSRATCLHHWGSLFHFLYHWGIGDVPTFVSISLFSQFSAHLKQTWRNEWRRQVHPQFWDGYSTDIRIQINPEIQIRIPDAFWFKFWRWRRFAVSITDRTSGTSSISKIQNVWSSSSSSSSFNLLKNRINEKS